MRTLTRGLALTIALSALLGLPVTAFAAPSGSSGVPVAGTTVASEDLPDITVVFADPTTAINASTALVTVDGRPITPQVTLSNANKTATLVIDAELLPVGYTNPCIHTVVASIANTAAQRSSDYSWSFTQTLPGGAREMAPTAETACKGCHSSVDDSLAFMDTHWIWDQDWTEPYGIIGPHYDPNSCANCHVVAGATYSDYGAWGLLWTEVTPADLSAALNSGYLWQQHGTTRYYDQILNQGQCSVQCHAIGGNGLDRYNYHRQGPVPLSGLAARGTPAWRGYVYNKYDDAAKYEVTDARYRYDCLHCHQGLKGSQAVTFPKDKELKSAHDIVGDHETALPSQTFCAGCHSRVLTREHAATGREVSGGGAIGCSTCHESADATVKGAYEQLPKIKYWRKSSRSYYVSPLRDVLLDRLDAPVSAPSGRKLTSARVQAYLQDQATIVVQALYGSTWQTVYTKVLDNPTLTAYPGLQATPPYPVNYLWYTEDITFAAADAVRLSVDPEPDQRIYATGPFFSQGIEYWSETYVSLERISSSPVSGTDAAPDCLTCHEQTAGTEHYAVHASTFPSAYCDGCHTDNLLEVPEHADAQGRPACAICHDPTTGSVADAVAANQTGCLGSCHPDHPHPAASITGQDAGNGHVCTECHSTSLYLEHVKSTRGGESDPCLVCHEDGGPADRIAGAWDTTCDTAECHAAGTPIEVHENYCLACHDTGQPDFATSKTAFPEVAAVDRDTACRSCHTSGLVGTHPYHQIGANCGAACHPGWGNSLSTATPFYTDAVSGASFANVSSKATPAAVLHIIHAVTRWPASVSTPSSACASCHAAAACNACHTGAVPATHSEHSASDQGTNPAWTGVVGHGIVGTDQSQRTAYTDTNQCSSADCHDLAGTASHVPGAVEDYNYAVGGNPDDPSGASSAVTVSGTWRSRASTRYTGGRMSYDAVAGDELTASFTGRRVEIVSDRDPYRGRADVLIDGAVVGSFDAYASVTRFQATVFSADVGPGAHTVTVRPTGTKSASARAAYVVVDAFRVFDEAPAAIAPSCVSCHTDRAGTHW